MFGDSLSDNGNGDGQFYDGTFPLPPYYKFRFSNGPTWIENFPADLYDYGYGGAVLNNTFSNGGPPSVMAQINDYLIGQHFDVSAIADDTLYVFWGGNNDIIDTVEAEPQLAQNLVYGLPFLTTWQIQKLITAGAKNILVMLLASWALAPSVTETASQAEITQLAQLTVAINGYIQSNVTALAAPGLNIKVFDVPAAFEQVYQNPQEYGLVNFTAPCLANWQFFINGTKGVTPQICSNPDEFFFWDGEHPTTKVHGILAKMVMEFLGW